MELLPHSFEAGVPTFVWKPLWRAKTTMVAQVWLTVILALGKFVAAQNALDPVRNNLSLPQVGLSILTSLSAVAGTLIKGELRAETSHKELLLLIYPLTFNNELHKGLSSGPDSFVWKLALWLEQKGIVFLKTWCQLRDESSPERSGCLLVRAPKVTFSHRLMVSWFWLNCNYSLRVVTVPHPAECQHCLQIARSEWTNIRDCIPVSWRQQDQILDDPQSQLVVYKCMRHGGSSMLGGIITNPFESRTRIGILLPTVKLEDTEPDSSDDIETKGADAEPDLVISVQSYDKECLVKAFCTLDSVERNLLSDTARSLVMADEVPKTGGLGWSAGRRMTALVMEVAVAVLLSWGGQMPPLSASLVGRRLVRSYATGGRGNSPLLAGATGNEAHVNVEQRVITAVEVFSSVSHPAAVRTLELTLVVAGVVVQYGIWLAVLAGSIPRFLGAAPKGGAVVAKACISTLALSLCCFLCCFKGLRRQAPFVRRGGVRQLVWILAWHLVSQLVVWLVVYAHVGDKGVKVALLAGSCAMFGEAMWLTAMWSGAHHHSLADRIAWDRTAAHAAPYIADAAAALILAI